MEGQLQAQSVCHRQDSTQSAGKSEKAVLEKPTQDRSSEKEISTGERGKNNQEDLAVTETKVQD